MIPENEPSKKGKCIQFIAKECLLHKINIHGGSANEWHEFLCECIKLEKKNQILLTMHQWHQEGVDKVPLVEFMELLIPEYYT